MPRARSARLVAVAVLAVAGCGRSSDGEGISRAELQQRDDRIAEVLRLQQENDAKVLEAIKSLSDALDAMEQSELVAEALGEHIFEWFLRNKRSEWFDYKSQVTQFELDRYLPNI